MNENERQKEREDEKMHTDIELAKVAFWHMVETQE